MFGSKNKNKQKTNENVGMGLSGPMDSACIISPGTIIEGKFKATDNVRVDGTILGDVVCDKRIVMGDSGKIVGTVVANEAAIRGRIEGELKVSETIHLHSTAFIQGTIIAKKLIVEEGASYNGECKVGENFTNSGVAPRVDKVGAKVGA